MSRLKELRKSILLGVYINLILLHILPIWMSNVFITLDGPAHTYSGSLIRQILLDQGRASEFFFLRTIPPPNVFVHIIQALFNGIINTGVFDKLMHSLWIFAFLLLSRSFILKLNQGAYYRPFLMFPFVFSFPFIMGFQNFLWGFIPILLAMHQLVRIQNGNYHIYRELAVNALILVFAYSCHLIAFLIIPFIQLAFLLFHPTRAKFKSFRIAAIIPFILIAIPAFMMNVDGGEFQNELSPDAFSRAYNWIRMSSIVSFSNSEQLLIWPLGILFTLLFIYCIWAVFKPSKPDKVIQFWQRILTFCACALLLAYFILPDHAIGGGFILVRIQLLTIIFIIPALACIRLRKGWMIPLAASFVIISLLHLKQQHLEWTELGKKAGEYIEVVAEIPENSVVMPVIWEKNWLYSNFPCLLGSRKQIIILDNYEASTNHFLVQWNSSLDPMNFEGFTGNTNTPCLNPNNYPKTIDYIYSWGAIPTLDSCGISSSKLLLEQWDLIWSTSNKNGKLYKKKAQLTLK